MRILKYYFFFFLSLFSYGEEKFYPHDIKRLRDQNCLTIALHKKDYFPFFFVHNNILKGHDINLAYDIGKKLGVDKVIFDRSATSFDEVAQKVNEKKVDLALSYLSITLNRAKYVKYSDDYVAFQMGYLINRKKAAHLDINTIKDIPKLNNPSLRFGVEKGHAHDEKTRLAFPRAQFVYVDRIDNTVSELTHNTIDVIYSDQYVFKKLFDQKTDFALYYKLIYDPEDMDYLSIASHPEDTHLSDWINLYLKMRALKPTAEKIYQDNLLLLRNYQ